MTIKNLKEEFQILYGDIENKTKVKLFYKKDGEEILLKDREIIKNTKTNDFIVDILHKNEFFIQLYIVELDKIIMLKVSNELIIKFLKSQIQELLFMQN